VSLDVEVYAAAPVSAAELLSQLPEPAQWSDFGGELSYEGDGWQVLVGDAEEADADEVPEDLAGLLPEARYLIPITLEPIGAPDDGQAFLERVIEAVGSTTSGVTNDFRTGAPRRF
jgi:hypothetical protein